MPRGRRGSGEPPLPRAVCHTAAASHTRRYCGLLTGGTAELAKYTALKKCHSAFGPTFVKAILCNWLVCMAVFLAGAPRPRRVEKPAPPKRRAEIRAAFTTRAGWGLNHPCSCPGTSGPCVQCTLGAANDLTGKMVGIYLPISTYAAPSTGAEQPRTRLLV